MNRKSKQILFSIFGILSLLVITIGVTYAVFTYTKEGTTDNIVTTGTLKFLYTENSAGGTGINISEAEPISDAQGKELIGDKNVFDFKVEATNTGNEVIPYEVTLRKKDTSTMSEENVKVYLTDETESTDIVEPTLYSKLTQTNIDVGSNIEKTLYKGKVAGGELTYLKTFRLRMWIDENSNQDDINGKSFTGMVNVYSNAKLAQDTVLYTESILNGTDPVLKDNLVPVKIATDGTVTKADLYQEWYNYENKEWANAVILKDETITYSNGDIIPEFIRKYNMEGQDLVEIDVSKAKAEGVNLMQRDISCVTDGYVRHNPDAIAASIIQLICDDLKFNDMQNNTQYMILNDKLKDAKKSLKQDQKARPKTNNKTPRGKSKFYQKYQERIKSIQEAEIKEKEREKKRNMPKRGRKKKEETKIEIKPLR